MSSDLTHGGFTICDASGGDFWHVTRLSRDAPRLVMVPFAGTAGMELKVEGHRDTAETARRVVFGSSGSGRVTRVYKTDRATMETFLHSIESRRAVAANLVGSLVFGGQTYAGMAWVSFAPGAILYAGDKGVRCDIEMEFVRVNV